MGIGPVKTATVIPAHLPVPKFAGAGTEEATSPTVEALQGMFFGDAAGGSTTPDAATDPFLALRAAVEAGGALQTPPAPTKVPSVEELVANDPSLVTFADGTVKELYGQLQYQLESYKVLLEGKMQGLASPAQIHAMQQVLQKVEGALLQIAAELAKVEELAEQAIAMYEQEVTELMPKALKGEITPEEADLNHDGYIGDPTTTDYVIGYQTVAGETIAKILLKGTKRPVPADPKTGLPLQGNVRDPNYAWSIANGGLQPIDGTLPEDDTTHQRTDLTLQLGSLDGTSNFLGAPIGINVPEFVWVRADEKHPDQPARNALDHYDVKPFTGLTQTAPTADEKDDWIQVKVTDFLVGSDNAPPLGWPEGQSWSQAAGVDHIVTLKDKTGEVIMQIRITGSATTNADNPYAKDGYIAASSVGLAFTAGEGDMARKSAIHFKVEDTFLSTGRHIADLTDYNFDIGGSGPAAEDQTRKTGAMKANLERFRGDGNVTASGYSVDKDRTGVFVQGLKGNLEGSAYNDFFDVPPLIGEDAEHATTVDAGYGFNAVIAGEGDHFIKGATFVQINSTGYGDVNYIDTPSNTHTKWLDAQGNITSYDVAAGSPANPRVYVQVKTPGGKTVVNNGVEGDTEGDADDPKDDFYDISGSGEINFTNTLDKDLPQTAAGQDSLDAMNVVFGENVVKVNALIMEEVDEEAEGKLNEADWDFGSDIYGQAKESQDAFFKEWGKAYGLPSGSEEEDDETGDAVEGVFGG